MMKVGRKSELKVLGVAQRVYIRLGRILRPAWVAKLTHVQRSRADQITCATAVEWFATFTASPSGQNIVVENSSPLIAAGHQNWVDHLDRPGQNSLSLTLKVCCGGAGTTGTI